MNSQQLTFSDINTVHRIKSLTRNQRKIISLVSLQLTQADIAHKLGYSRPYINQTIKRLESLGMIKRLSTQPAREGIREYNLFYEVCPDIKIPDQEFTACRIHNIRKKFTIIRQSGPASTDERASFTRSWPMRGWQGHKFWYPGKAGLPSVTIDANPKTLVIYVDKGQNIIARDTEQAKEIAWYAIYAARDKFIEQQERFHVTFEIERVGEDIAKVHGGFAIGEKTAKQGITVPGWWIDQSDTGEMSYAEAETDIPEGMSRLDRTIKLSEKIGNLEALPEAMKEINEKLNPMNGQLAQLVSQLQGGRPIEAMFQNALDMMLRMMEKMDRMDDQIRVLKGGK
jgi:DNA-binding CsgD family transcriptional regulator